jgi:hypothetical protein
LAGFAARFALGPDWDTPAASAFFTAAALLVHRLPGALFRRFLGIPAFAITFLDVLGLAFLLLRIFGF